MSIFEKHTKPENFMMVEMTRDDQLGWFHNHFFKYVEDLWERPLAWVCRLLCLELGKDNYKRRIGVTWDNAERKEMRKRLTRRDNGLRERNRTTTQQKDVIQNNRAAKLELALFVALHVGFEMFQRVLDIQKRNSLVNFY